MKTAKRGIVHIGIILFGVLGFVASSRAATYYVDFDTGNDANSGTSATSSWKHAPGDANATGIPARKGYLTDPLQPGDTVLFKGGVVYRGSIYIDGRWINGSQANPVTYKGDGWGSGKAVLDGSAVLPNAWQPCASQASCAGNPHWQNIYYADISGNYTFDQGFYENDEFLWYSQNPNPADPFVYDRTEYLRVIPYNDANIHQTRTAMTDPRYFTQSDPAFWNGAYIISWRIPNVMAIKKITGYDPASHTIHYDDLGGDIYADRDSYYSILNHLSMIDTPGEFCYNETTHRLYVWPRQTPVSQESFSVRTLDAGIFNSCVSNLNIEGFIVRKYVMGIRAIDSGTGITPQNDIIRNNEVRKLKCNDWYAIQVGGNNIRVENNSVTDCQRAVGILGGGDNVVISNNFVSRASREGIWFMGASNSRITGNTVVDCNGTHANGISVYMNSRNNTVSGNRVSNSNIAFTFEQSNNLNVMNNLFLGDGNISYVVASWGQMTGTVNFFNNVILGSDGHCSAYLGPDTDTAVFNFKNNIVDGGGRDQRSNNIYTGLCWNQDISYGWSPGPGEIVETNLANIFKNSSAGDYSLKAGSPAIDKGADLSSLFNIDYAGVSRPQGSAWDIGAYEYVSPPAAPTGLQVW